MIFEKTVEKIYKKNIYVRCDDTGWVFYFTEKDFPGLHKEPFEFYSSHGHILRGAYYFYDGYAPGRLIVFDHGHGGGHTAYMTEIELLCKRGYKVFAYDHTGCMTSGGESSNGLTQSLTDLNDCICALKNDEKNSGVKISVVGHSWGGYSTLNIAGYHPDITHVVSMCGYISVKRMIEQNFSGILKFFRKHIYEMEKKSNPDFVDSDAIKALSETNAKVLLIYSDDDPMTKKEYHYDVLREKLSGKENISFILEHEKGHNPNYTVDAVKYKDQFVASLSKENNNTQATKEEKDKFISTFDWKRMTMQDTAVWEKIYEHLEK
ncbi:MAG: alpha/beta fold hydrolase [Anaerofustis stercorihominis]|nr:alpha/beta fold hydrolase [Anaerofustis stercorihominis]